MGKLKLRKCATKFCRKKSHRKYCPKCVSKKYRETKPLEYCYHALKNNAKRRKKLFALTLEEFKQFCVETNYLDKKGRTSKKYSIDRICNDVGYIRSNIRCITVAENTSKHAKREDVSTPF